MSKTYQVSAEDAQVEGIQRSTPVFQYMNRMNVKLDSPNDAIPFKNLTGNLNYTLSVNTYITENPFQCAGLLSNVTSYPKQRRIQCKVFKSCTTLQRGLQGEVQSVCTQMCYSAYTLSVQ